jgi:hypothetical protein
MKLTQVLIEVAPCPPLQEPGINKAGTNYRVTTHSTRNMLILVKVKYVNFKVIDCLICAHVLQQNWTF